MNLVRCENGHFYDGERFTTCPHCNQGSVSTIMQDDNGMAMYTMPVTPEDTGNDVYTIPLDSPISPTVPVQAPSGLDDLIMDAKQTEDGGQATIGYFGDMDEEPVVGWLIIMEGSHYGKDFRLKSGRNFIGRSSQMDVALTDDPSISRERHAIILYEPKANMFLVQPGDSRELFYLNDKVVLSAMEISAYDVLSLGNTKLLFIPLCSEKFNWDSVTDKKEDKKE